MGVSFGMIFQRPEDRGDELFSLTHRTLIVLSFCGMVFPQNLLVLEITNHNSTCPHRAPSEKQNLTGGSYR